MGMTATWTLDLACGGSSTLTVFRSSPLLLQIDDDLIHLDRVTGPDSDLLDFAG
jgi:hypothetical protein